MTRGPAVRAVLAFDLLVQLLLLPIDPHAYATGAFTGLGSFVPNTVLHLVLAAGFLRFLLAPVDHSGSRRSRRR